MLTAVHELESVIWSIADGRASADDLERFNADHDVSLFVIDRLSADVEDQIAAATAELPDDIRDQVLADLTSELRSLQLTAEIITGPNAGEVPGEARLQASWAHGKIVVWAGGPSAPPEANAELADRLEQIGGPPNDWVVHPGITMTTGLYAGAVPRVVASHRRPEVSCSAELSRHVSPA